MCGYKGNMFVLLWCVSSRLAQKGLFDVYHACDVFGLWDRMCASQRNMFCFHVQWQDLLRRGYLTWSTTEMSLGFGTECVRQKGICFSFMDSGKTCTESCLTCAMHGMTWSRPITKDEVMLLTSASYKTDQDNVSSLGWNDSLQTSGPAGASQAVSNFVAKFTFRSDLSPFRSWKESTVFKVILCLFFQPLCIHTYSFIYRERGGCKRKRKMDILTHANALARTHTHTHTHTHTVTDIRLEVQTNKN